MSFHGFALNVSTDLSYFNLINPCGMPEITMTSLQHILKKEVSMEGVKQKVVNNFCGVFDCSIEETCLEKLL